VIPPSQINIYRDISFSSSQVLAKQSEEALLWRDIENDLAQQVLRRLAAAKPAAS
jgi:LPS-assembly lipoprotein